MKKIILTEFMSGRGICAPDGHVYKDCPLFDLEARLLQCLLLNSSKILLYKFNRENKNWN